MAWPALLDNDVYYLLVFLLSRRPLANHMVRDSSTGRVRGGLAVEVR